MKWPELIDVVGQAEEKRLFALRGEGNGPVLWLRVCV